MTTVLTPQTCGHSRAAARPIRPGSTATCASCDEPVKFAARVRRYQVIANVYVNGSWARVEHYHPECYEAAKTPYGEPVDWPTARVASPIG